jgi:DNA-directed RNA polymerase alpha subunit/DNA-binding XRE family transcriptional regulator
MNLKIIQRTEAAKRLGVNRQTITNWAEKGIIHLKTINNVQYVSEEEVIQIATFVCDYTYSQKLLQREIDALKQDRKNMRLSRMDAIANRRYLRLCDKYGITKEFYKCIINMLFKTKDLRKREADVILMLLNDYSYDEIAEEHCLTRERIRQIAGKAIRKSQELKNLAEKIEHIKQLETDNTSLRIANKALMEEVETLRELKDVKVEEKPTITLPPDPFLDFLSTKVVDIQGLSVRAKNIMFAACDRNDDATIADVCRFSKTDILKVRNCGKKSLQEIVDYLEKHNAYLGMNVDEIMKKRTEYLLNEE